MSDDRFIADGHERLEKSAGYRAAHAEVIAAVRARYAESIANAGVVRRFVLLFRMQREIARELDRLAPPDALYLQFY